MCTWLGSMLKLRGKSRQVFALLSLVVCLLLIAIYTSQQETFYAESKEAGDELIDAFEAGIEKLKKIYSPDDDDDDDDSDTVYELTTPRQDQVQGPTAPIPIVEERGPTEPHPVDDTYKPTAPGPIGEGQLPTTPVPVQEKNAGLKVAAVDKNPNPTKSPKLSENPKSDENPEPVAPKGHTNPPDAAKSQSSLKSEFALRGEKYHEVAERFKKRKKRLQGACTRFENNFKYPTCELNDVKFNLKYVNESNILYCAIEKTGSTFWKRILHVVGGWGNTSNPTDIKPKDADTNNGGFRTFKKRSWKVIDKAFSKSTNIMFVRDPYTRAFSAWLDKFYSANVYYWNTTGRVIKSRRPKGTNDSSNTCGFDISFHEFITYLINDVPKGCMDGHFAPNYKHCVQCNYSYEYIGKYETLQEDTFFLLETLNLTKTVQFTDFQSDAAYDAIKGVSEWVFKQKSDIIKCGLTLYCALFKVWKRLQARGIFSKEMNYPYKDDAEVMALTKDQLLNDMHEAHKKGDPVEMKKNRKEAIANAFNSLDVELLKQYRETFKIDFEMFDYEVKPDYLKETSPFRYFDKCPGL